MGEAAVVTARALSALKCIAYALAAVAAAIVVPVLFRVTAWLAASRTAIEALLLVEVLLTCGEEERGTAVAAVYLDVTLLRVEVFRGVLLFDCAAAVVAAVVVIAAAVVVIAAAVVGAVVTSFVHTVVTVVTAVVALLVAALLLRLLGDLLVLVLRLPLLGHLCRASLGF